nr:hypothetical protein [Tanacetum cinerariifolium]
LLFAVAFVLFRGEVLFWQFSHSQAPELARMVLCSKLLFLNVLVHAFFAIYSTLLTSTRHQTVRGVCVLELRVASGQAHAGSRAVAHFDPTGTGLWAAVWGLVCPAPGPRSQLVARSRPDGLSLCADTLWY